MAELNIDEELVKQLKMAKRKPRYFLLVAKSAKVGKLLVSKKKIKPKQIKELKDEAKCKKVFVGTCKGEGGNNVIFELTEEGPPNGDKLLKKLIREDAGLKMMPQIRVVTDLTTVDEEGPDEEGAPEAPGEEESLEAPPPPPEAPETPEEPVDADAINKLKTALAGLIQLVNRVVPAHPSRKAEIMGLVTEINTAIKAGDTATAKAKLLEAGNLVKGLTGKAPEAPDAKETEEKVEGAPDAPAPSPEAKEEAEKVTNKFSTTKFQKARQAWIGTRKGVHAELQKLEQAILKEFSAEDDINDIKQDVRALDEVLVELDETLANKLDEAVKAQDPDQRRALHLEAVGLMDKYKSYVNTDPFISDLEDNPFVPLKIKKIVSKTLDVLQKSIG